MSPVFGVQYGSGLIAPGGWGLQILVEVVLPPLRYAGWQPNIRFCSGGITRTPHCDGMV